MFGCFSWTKRGTHERYGQKENKKMKEQLEFEKKVVIGYASLSRSKHITTEFFEKRLFKSKFKGGNKAQTKNGDWMESTEQDK